MTAWMSSLNTLFLENGITLKTGVLDALQRYHAFLIEKNVEMDLTNVPEADMPLLHYTDSLKPLTFPDLFPFSAKVIDVGSGAGFPGLMLAAARPDFRVTLLDSLRKRCGFLEEAAQKMGLSNVEVIHARAEDAARQAYRGCFDLAVARAVAPSDILLEYLLPFVKRGGRALCWKGRKALEEMDAGKKAAALLGGEISALLPMNLPGRTHYLLVADKTGETRKEYPRRAGMAKKLPLGSV